VRKISKSLVYTCIIKWIVIRIYIGFINDILRRIIIEMEHSEIEADFNDINGNDTVDLYIHIRIPYTSTISLEDMNWKIGNNVIDIVSDLLKNGTCEEYSFTD